MRKTMRSAVIWSVLGFIILVPTLVIFGWIFDNTTLTRVLPQFTPMNPVTAICFILVGIALVSERVASFKLKIIVFRIVGLSILFIGSTMLIKYLFDVDFFIDRILFEPKLGINRMAVTTSSNFFLLGVIFVSYPRLRGAINIFSSMILVVSVYSLIAYLFNFVGAYGKSLYNPMAIHTATVFFVISIYFLTHFKFWRGQMVALLRRKNIFVPVIISSIFLILAIITTGISVLVGSSIEEQAKLRFENHTDQVTSFISSEMDIYRNMSYGIQGLFAASESVSEAEWQEFMLALNIPENYPGVSGLSYAKKVNTVDLSSLDFTVYPINNSPEKKYYFPVTYITSFSGQPNTSPGFDFSSEENRRRTLETAIEKDVPTATPVILGSTSKLPLFSIYAPLYKNGFSHDTKEKKVLHFCTLF